MSNPNGFLLKRLYKREGKIMSIHSELHRQMPQKNNTPIFVVAAAVLVVVILVILIVSAFGKDDKDNVSSVLAFSEIKASSTNWASRRQFSSTANANIQLLL